ncbi:MAG: ABC transporter substrate-binding protein [Anaerolineaceae bacterium]|nr:ABC transporter substrate-binding protein [Anaerolineaceae bacterium]
MKKILQVVFALSLIATLLVGCSAPTATATQAPTALVTEATVAATAEVTAEATAEATSAPVADDVMVIYAPASTSSIPVIIAASKLQNVKLQLYTNQSQANTLFLRGEVSALVTGLSVGLDLYKNGAPVQMVNSFVSGLSYVVTYGKQVSSLSELKGQDIYIPFEGSPIEEATSYLAGKEGLTWKTDLSPVYSPFDASIELLKQGKATAVVLPEPNVTIVEGQPNIYISISLFDEWNKYAGNTDGYPQVGTFVSPEWASAHPDQVEAFNQALSDAIAYVESAPSEAVAAVKDNYKLPVAKLEKSLSRTHYNLVTGSDLQATINGYYQLIGKPLDENDSAFYYIPAK